VKVLGIEAGLNARGLAVIRMSVDLGTAFGITGEAIADSWSMVESLHQAGKWQPGPPRLCSSQVCLGPEFAWVALLPPCPTGRRPGMLSANARREEIYTLPRQPAWRGWRSFKAHSPVLLLCVRNQQNQKEELQQHDFGKHDIGHFSR